MQSAKFRHPCGTPHFTFYTLHFTLFRPGGGYSVPPFAAPLRHERPYPPMSKIEMLHLMTGKTARIIRNYAARCKQRDNKNEIGGLVDWWIGGLARRAAPKVKLRIRCGRDLSPTLLFGSPIHALFENMVRTKSRGAILLGNFSAHHENTVRTNSRRVQKTQKRRKGLRLSRPFRPLPLIRGSGLPNVTCKV